ncbi:MAG: hypothetical protein ACLUFV_10250 [Acutalibacteraceae bacterium]
MFKLVIPALFLAGAVLFGLRLYDGDDFFTALTAFVRVVATATPLTAFFIISLPVIAANRVSAARPRSSATPSARNMPTRRSFRSRIRRSSSTSSDHQHQDLWRLPHRHGGFRPCAGLPSSAARLPR